MEIVFESDNINYINPRSIRLVEKVGFKKTSVVENIKVVDGVSVSNINFILER